MIVSIADAGSINRAAISLKIAQSGLTAQLRRIESGFGGSLFIRRPSGITPTELGQHVIEGARDLAGRMDELINSARDLAASDDLTMLLRLGGSPGPLVPMLVSAVHDLWPGREQTSHVHRLPEQVVESLRRGALDVAVVAELPAVPIQLPPEVMSLPLLTEPVFVGLAGNHPLAGHSEVRLADLAGEVWTMPDDMPAAVHRGFRAACEAAGFTPRCRHFLPDSAATVEMVRSGHAVSGFYPTAYEFPGMVLRPLSGNPLRRQINLAWPEASDLGGHAVAIRDRILRSYHSLVRERPTYAAWWTTHNAALAGGHEH